jgi:hypothetical protein
MQERGESERRNVQDEGKGFNERGLYRMDAY